MNFEHFTLSRPLRQEEFDAVQKVLNEYVNAVDKFVGFNSAHEGYAVILEELDELWQEVKKKDGERHLMAAEACQVAAMGLRFMIDVAAKK